MLNRTQPEASGHGPQFFSRRARQLLIFLSCAGTFGLGNGSLDAGYANVGTVMFDFNSLSANMNSTSDEDAIENYMESVYGSEITLMWGSKTMKNKPENVGPRDYLGNTELMVYQGGLKDTYLMNRWNASGPSELRDRIIIEFLEVPVSAIEFDWQIFPVTRGKADLTVLADGVNVFYYDNAANLRNGAMGHASLTFASPVTRLEFVDWSTAPIGIDNLQILQTEPVPEPSTCALFLLGSAGVAFARRRRIARA